MKRIIILCLGAILLVFSSCDKDEAIIDSVIAPENVECSTLSCDPNNQSFDTPDCKPVFFGHYELSEWSESRFADFYLTKGDTISFYSVDSVQNFVVETIFENDPSTGFLSIETNKSCKCDPTNFLRYCLMGTARYVRYLSVEDSTEFLLTLSTKPDARQEIIGAIADVLTITRDADYNTHEFYAVIDKRTSSLTEPNEIYDSITLNNQVYTDVISYESFIFSPIVYKFYYEPEFGLLAFRDGNNVLWVRN